MNIQSSTIKSEEKHLSHHWCFIIVSLALGAGLLLSILSWLEICVEHCSANQEYKIFGMPFAFVGIAFFSFVIVLHLLSIRYPFLRSYVGWLIATAAGSEIMFIAVQKYQIGHWCPVCLSIAASVGIAGLALSTRYFKDLFYRVKNNKGGIMHKLKSGLITFSFILLGFFSSFVGVTKVDAAQAALAEMKDKLMFGNKNSPVEIYIFTDWFCPSCRKVEPIIEKIYPKIKERATIYFIDYPIHKKSLNFTPYHLSFEIHNKPQYFKARHLLDELTQKTESPTDEDVMELANKNDINFKELSFLDVKNGMEFFDQLVQKFHLNATPVIIITNKNGSKVEKLEGRDEITEKRILAAIEKIEKTEKKH